MNRRDCLKACAATFGSFFLSSAAFAQSQTAELQTEVVSSQLRFTIALTNTSALELHDQVLWLYAPIAITPTQKLANLNVSMSYGLSSDPLQHSIVMLAFPHVAPLATKIVSIVADVELTKKPAMLPLVNVQSWLNAEPYIETSDERIQLLAAELKHATARSTAMAIYDWIKQHIQYAGYIAEDRGALDALISRRGDCTEYAYLAVALARGNGIPARMVGGYVVDGNTLLRAQDYHNWAELYFDGAWQLLDAQKENWLEPAQQYVSLHYYQDKSINPIGLAHRFRMKGDLQVRL